MEGLQGLFAQRKYSAFAAYIQKLGKYDKQTIKEVSRVLENALVKPINQAQVTEIDRKMTLKIKQSATSMLSAMLFYKQLLFTGDILFFQDEDVFPVSIHRTVAHICQFKLSFVTVLEGEQLFANTITRIALEIIVTLAEIYPIDCIEGESRFKKHFDKLSSKGVHFPKQCRFIKEQQKDKFRLKLQNILKMQQQENNNSQIPSKVEEKKNNNNQIPSKVEEKKNNNNQILSKVEEKKKNNNNPIPLKVQEKDKNKDKNNSANSSHNANPEEKTKISQKSTINQTINKQMSKNNNNKISQSQNYQINLANKMMNLSEQPIIKVKAVEVENRKEQNTQFFQHSNEQYPSTLTLSKTKKVFPRMETKNIKNTQMQQDKKEQQQPLTKCKTQVCLKVKKTIVQSFPKTEKVSKICKKSQSYVSLKISSQTKRQLFQSSDFKHPNNFLKDTTSLYIPQSFLPNNFSLRYKTTAQPFLQKTYHTKPYSFHPSLLTFSNFQRLFQSPSRHQPLPLCPKGILRPQILQSLKKEQFIPFYSTSSVQCALLRQLHKTKQNYQILYTLRIRNIGHQPFTFTLHSFNGQGVKLVSVDDELRSACPRLLLQTSTPKYICFTWAEYQCTLPSFLSLNALVDGVDTPLALPITILDHFRECFSSPFPACRATMTGRIALDPCRLKTFFQMHTHNQGYSVLSSKTAIVAVAVEKGLLYAMYQHGSMQGKRAVEHVVGVLMYLLQPN